MSKYDTLLSLAAVIDGFEIAAGGTVTQVQIDTMKAISVELKSLAEKEPVPALAVIEPPKGKTLKELVEAVTPSDVAEPEPFVKSKSKSPKL